MIPLLNSKCAYGSILDSQDGQHRIIKEVILFRLLQEGGHSLRQKDFTEKRQGGLGFYRRESGEDSGQQVSSEGQDDLIWSGVGLI